MLYNNIHLFIACDFIFEAIYIDNNKHHLYVII